MWFPYALATAFLDSARDVLSKKNLMRYDPYVVAFAVRLLTIPFVLPFVLLNPLPPIGPDFFRALFWNGTFNIVSSILYMKAIQASDLSLTAPMVTFTPLFLLITSPLIVHEFPSAFGLIGVILIVAGAYTLHIQQRHSGILAPLKSIWKHKGPRLMLLTAFMWSISSNFDKIGVSNSSPFVWIVTVNSFIALGLLPFVAFVPRRARALRHGLSSLVVIGFVNAAMLICHMIAVKMTLVAYLISVKRLSALISVLFGVFLFKEGGLRERALGSVLMILGVICISLFG